MGTGARGRPYEWPDRRVSRAEARRRFLGDVRACAPRVLAHLAGDPLDRARAVWTAAADPGCWLHEVDLDWATLVANAGDDPSGVHPERTLLAALRDALLRWARLYKLDRSEGDWLLNTALDTVGVWCADPDLPAEGRRGWGGAVAPLRQPLGDADREIGPFTWEPGIEGRAEAERRIAAEVRARLDERERAMRERHLVPVPEYRHRRDDHMRWLVLYQVERSTVTEIAKGAGVTAKAVRDALKATAAEVGLALRPPDRPGRPPGPRHD